MDALPLVTQAVRATLRRSQRSVSLTLGLLAVALLACGKSDGGSGPPGGGATTGSLVVAVIGLPVGTPGSVVVTGPGGFSRALTATETLASLAPGSYTIAAERVITGLVAYDADAATQSLSVTASNVAVAASVNYAIRTGALAIVLSGLPDGVAGAVTVTGPGGYTHAVTQNTTLSELTPGTYGIAVAAVPGAGHTFAPSVLSSNVAVVASATPANGAVTYALTTGAIAVSINGLPGGALGTATLIGPNGYTHAFPTSETVTNLSPGSYTLTSNVVAFEGDSYSDLSVHATIAISASMIPVATRVSYLVSTGRLTVVASGLPSGSTPAFSLTGPGGFSRSVAAGETVTGLLAGSYTVTGPSVTSGTSLYSPSAATQNVTVTATTVASQVAFVYAVSSGGLTVAVVGLPQSLAASVTITGPAGYSTTIATTATLTGLTPGSYTIAASNALAGSHIYAPTPVAQTVVVQAGVTRSASAVAYALASGAISLTVSGLPPSVPASITVTGPGGYSNNVTATGLLLGLTPGSYTISAAAVSGAAQSYAPNPAARILTISASMSAVSAVVTYVAANGSFALAVSGLPNGVNANLTVSGPSGFSQHPTGSQTFIALAGGTYTVAAQAVTSGPTTYTPLPLSQNVSIIGGTAANASVTYSAVNAGLNLLIDAAYITQSVQSYSGTVPLVADRDGLLRVFVKATLANSATPAVRARFYNGATLLSTISISASGTSVPTTINESMMAASWNATVPAALLQPGISMLIDVDPTNAVTEASEADNAFPTSGIAQALNIQSVAPFQIRLVPVTQSVNSLTGNVSNANKGQFLSLLTKLYPVSTVDVDVRAPYTTSAPELDANNANGSWTQILGEINALRTADANARYYYGVVSVTYNSGVAGVGYVPGRAAIGWDNLPSGGEVLTHEVGHNFGRFHAPCGGAGGVDPSYPYPGGTIGVSGYDVALATLKSASLPDIMGYCSSPWISDYNYSAILAYRQSHPFVGTSAAAARPGLLVWGRIVNGEVILEPTYEIVARPVLPAATGRHRLELAGENGESLLALSFDGEHIADSPTNDETFAFVVPLEMLRGRALARLRVTSGARGQEAREPAGVRRPLVREASDLPRVTRSGRNAVRISWSDAAVRGVLIRDARTGDILSFARGGDAVVQTDAANLELTISNGVRSERHNVVVR
ncbi:MAG: hypothetical protein ABI877_03230 [Gemmatimonadaceae bacterium]